MSGDFHKIGNIKGANGVGVPEGGQRGQVLRKVGDTDFATGWGSVNYADVEGKVPKSALPDLGIAPMPVKSEAEMLNLPAVVGNMAIRTDLGKTFVLMEEPASTLSNWLELVTTSDVQSVNGQTGNVQLTKADVGLSKVDNTADSDKPEATTSVRGLMPAADKAKLNNATSAATASRLAIRDSAGRISFKQVTLSDAPTSNAQAATKSYVDTEVGQRVKNLGVLGSGVDLNNLKESAVGVQTVSVNAKPELNYPEHTAGAIQVIESGSSMTYQYYTTYSQTATKIFWRTWYSNSWGAWKQLVDTAMLNTEITAAKKHTDDRFGALAGGSVLSNTDWDAMRSTASTGVVEGFVKGCPAGGVVSNNSSVGFVTDPVWRLEVRPEGLNYVTQRATLLNCTPKYMVGFVWERIYNPATAKWSSWLCVGGDTGPIYSVGTTGVDMERPVRHVNSDYTKLYNTSQALILRRAGGTVAFSGAMASKASGITTNEGTNLGRFADEARHLFIPGGYAQKTVCQGSGKEKWYFQVYGDNAFACTRYTGTPTSNTWLPFSLTWIAPAIGTYGGSGWGGIEAPPQSGTGN